MKKLILCIVTCSIAIGIWATAQTGDLIIINGEMWVLLARPINYDSALYQGLKTILPGERAISSANWDGYTAYWSIRNEQVYLDSIKVRFYNSETNEEKNMCLPSSDVLRVFKRYASGKNIPASWVSKELRTAKGKVIYYVHDAYERYYEEELLFTATNGKVTDMKAFHNQLVTDGYTLDAFNPWKINELCPLHKTDYPDMEDIKAVFFEVTDVKVDSLGNMIDCNIKASIRRSDNNEWQYVTAPAQEMKERLMSLRPWKTALVYGEYIAEINRGVFFRYVFKE